MKRIVIGVAAACLLAAAVARAQTTVHTFVTVDAVRSEYQKLLVTGVRAGETVATTQALVCTLSSTDAKCAAQLQNCQRLALLAMTKPGQYTFEIEPYSSFDRCTLRRVVP